MKKLALTSLIAMFAFTGAHAANVIDGNPLYMPKAGHFYSETGLSSHTNNVDQIGLKESVGYGITNRLAFAGAVSGYEEDWFDSYIWNTAELNMTVRAYDSKDWKLDLMGGYVAGDTGVSLMGINGGLIYKFPGNGTEYFDKDATFYTWTAGVRGGYTTGDFTIAGHFNMLYLNEESFAWNNKDKSLAHLLNFGVNTQLVLNKNWSVLAGAEYWTDYEDYHHKVGMWELTFGANYNIDATKYVGAYITKLVDHTGAIEEGTWEFVDGFGMGVKFGIDF